MLGKMWYLRVVGSLFAPLGDDYPRAYDAAREAGATHGARVDIPVPSVLVRRRLEGEVLACGSALSAPPVESLYRPWAEDRAPDGDPPAFGGARHLLLGDSAQHLSALYRILGLEVPEAFRAMPDHVALASELVFLLAYAGNEAAARTVLADHFAWVDDYRAYVVDRASACRGARQPAPLPPGSLEALEHAAVLTAALAEAVQAIEESLEETEVERANGTKHEKETYSENDEGGTDE